MDEGQLTAATPEPAADAPPQSRWSRPPVRVAVVALAIAVVAVVLWGGYGHHWPWTGINGSTATLWDWLHLLLLPVAFGMLPILLSERTRVRREHRLAGSVALLCLITFVVAGYSIPWAWTGFSGNRLWDWLELLALPLAVALLPLVDDIRRTWSLRHSVAAGVALTALIVAVIGGYAGHWSWTGFRGNTLWDWLHLLLLPLLLPVIVSKARPRMEATMIVVETPDEARLRVPSEQAAGQPPEPPEPPEPGADQMRTPVEPVVGRPPVA